MKNRRVKVELSWALVKAVCAAVTWIGYGTAILASVVNAYTVCLIALLVGTAAVCGYIAATLGGER